MNYSIHDANIFDIKKQLEIITNIPYQKQHLYAKTIHCQDSYRNSINNRLKNDNMQEYDGKRGRPWFLVGFI